MSGKNTNLYRFSHYFLKVHGDGWGGSFDFTAINDERAKKYARAWIREKNKRNKKLIAEGKIERGDWEIASFSHLSRINIEPAEKEIPVRLQK